MTPVLGGLLHAAVEFSSDTDFQTRSSSHAQASSISAEDVQALTQRVSLDS